MRRLIAIVLVLSGGLTQAARLDCWSGGSPGAVALSGAHRAGGTPGGTPAEHIEAAHAHVDGAAPSTHGQAGHHGALPDHRPTGAHEHGPGSGETDLTTCPLVAACNASGATAPRVGIREAALPLAHPPALATVRLWADVVSTAEPPPPRLPI